MDFKTFVGFILRNFFEKIAGGSKYPTQMGYPKFDQKLRVMFRFFRSVLEFYKKEIMESATKSCVKIDRGEWLKNQRF